MGQHQGLDYSCDPRGFFQFPTRNPWILAENLCDMVIARLFIPYRLNSSNIHIVFTIIFIKNKHRGLKYLIPLL